MKEFHCFLLAFETAQVKKLQAMLRQANDQLERTLRERQGLEAALRRSAEDTSLQVRGSRPVPGPGGSSPAEQGLSLARVCCRPTGLLGKSVYVRGLGSSCLTSIVRLRFSFPFDFY